MSSIQRSLNALQYYTGTQNGVLIIEVSKIQRFVIERVQSILIPWYCVVNISSLCTIRMCICTVYMVLYVCTYSVYIHTVYTYIHTYTQLVEHRMYIHTYIFHGVVW